MKDTRRGAEARSVQPLSRTACVPAPKHPVCGRPAESDLVYVAAMSVAHVDSPARQPRSGDRVATFPGPINKAHRTK
ncbi:unnamed protein product, partial [Iphiclides podalirius]